MTDHEALQGEVARTQAQVAKAAEAFVERAQFSVNTPGFWDLRGAVKEHQEAERRAMREATL